MGQVIGYIPPKQAEKPAEVVSEVKEQPIVEEKKVKKSAKKG